VSCEVKRHAPIVRPLWRVVDSGHRRSGRIRGWRRRRGLHNPLSAKSWSSTCSIWRL